MELSIQKIFKLLARIQPLDPVEEKLEMWNGSSNIFKTFALLIFPVILSYMVSVVLIFSMQLVIQLLNLK